MRRGELMNRLGQKKSFHMYWPVMIMTSSPTIALGGCLLVQPLHGYVQETADGRELPGYVTRYGVDVVRPKTGQEHFCRGGHPGKGVGPHVGALAHQGLIGLVVVGLEATQGDLHAV